MSYLNSQGQTYRYTDFFSHNVYFPADSTIILDSSKKDTTVHWEYALPLAADTKDWDNVRKRSPYSMAVTAYKGANPPISQTINDIEITGSILALTYIQPVN